MAEVLVDYDIRVAGAGGRLYEPQACGRARADGLWEGWIEFVPIEGEPLRTGRETTQPNRDDLMYWAQGLTATYLEGALRRALGDTPPIPPRRAPTRSAAFDAPAEARWRSDAAHARSRAVLDPFHVYAEGADVLRNQLNALSEDQLRNIIHGYELAEPETVDLTGARRAELAEVILRGVEQRRR